MTATSKPIASGTTPEAGTRRRAHLQPGRRPGLADVAVPLRLRDGEAEPAFLSTRTTFGTAVHVTVAELSIESFHPPDRSTAETMQALLDERAP